MSGAQGRDALGDVVVLRRHDRKHRGAEGGRYSGDDVHQSSEGEGVGQHGGQPKVSLVRPQSGRLQQRDLKTSMPAAHADADF